MNIGLLGQARLGWRQEQHSLRLETGLPLQPEHPLRVAGWMAQFQLDQLNRLYLPTAGWSLRASWFESTRDDYNRVDLKLNTATPMADWVMGLRATYAGSTHGRLPAQDSARLGGLLNLSGFATGQLIGDRVAYGHLRFERIIGRMPVGLRGDMRVGVSLEAGKVGRPLADLQRTGWLDSAALYLGGETPVGPMYVGLGYSTQGRTNAYLAIGTP
jgi:NTE family protein